MRELCGVDRGWSAYCTGRCTPWIKISECSVVPHISYRVFVMATVYDSPILRQRLNCLRLQEMEDDEVQTFGRCDCKSYSYFALSMLLFSVGTVVTVMALGDSADGFIIYHLGHMWLVGPIFICSGLMVAVKSMLYLRRKSIIQMLLHQRAIFRASFF